MRQMKAKVDRDLAALNRVSLAARVCFARAKNPSGSSSIYDTHLVTPNGNITETQTYGRIIASATHLRGDLDFIAREWKSCERREFESEVLFHFGSIAGIAFMAWAWTGMLNSGFDLGAVAYAIFMAVIFSFHFRQRLAQRHDRLNLIERKWHEHDVPGMMAALRSGDKRWTKEPNFDESVSTPVI